MSRSKAQSGKRREPITSQPHTSVSVSEELSRLREKREVLEELLSQAYQLTNLLGSMELVQQIFDPAQSPAQATGGMALYRAEAAALATPALLASLETLDKDIASDFGQILALSMPGAKASVAGSSKSGEVKDVIAATKARLRDFRSRGEMNVAVRYVLHERGVPCAATTLPVSPEEIAARLATVRKEERHCRGRLRNEMEGMVADVDRIIAKPDCPDPIRRRMLALRDNLDQSLALLAENRSLDELPTTVEVIELSSDEAPPEPKVASVPLPPAAAGTLHKRGFWQKLRLWLNSPWSVRWRDLDRLD